MSFEFDPKMEQQFTKEDMIDSHIRDLLQYIGDDPDREGLLDTPRRVRESYRELFAGYKQDPQIILKEFDSEGYDQAIILDSIEFYSTCEHHMMPFVGTASVAYIPGVSKKIVGISKLARLVDCYSRRLQVQERLTSQIVDSLMQHLKPLGAACYISAKHFCVCGRGVGKQSSVMKTTQLRGVFKEEADTRAEFYSMIATR